MRNGNEKNIHIFVGLVHMWKVDNSKTNLSMWSIHGQFVTCLLFLCHISGQSDHESGRLTLIFMGNMTIEFKSDWPEIMAWR